MNGEDVGALFAWLVVPVYVAFALSALSQLLKAMRIYQQIVRVDAVRQVRLASFGQLSQDLMAA